MGRIRFRRFYTDIVEHYLRMAVRHRFVNGTVPQEWHKFTTEWIERLSDEDKEFIRFVFDKSNFNSFEGVSRYHRGIEAEGNANYELKLDKLMKLEKQFAIEAGFYTQTLEANESNK